MKTQPKHIALGLLLGLFASFCIAATPLKNVILQSDLDAAGNKVIDLGAPTDPADAATKDYVDTNFATISDSLEYLGALTPAANKLIFFNSGSSASMLDFPSFSQGLISSGTSAAQMRSTLGLVIGTDVLSPTTAAATYLPLSGGTLTGDVAANGQITAANAALGSASSVGNRAAHDSRYRLRTSVSGTASLTVASSTTLVDVPGMTTPSMSGFGLVRVDAAFRFTATNGAGIKVGVSIPDAAFIVGGFGTIENATSSTITLIRPSGGSLTAAGNIGGTVYLTLWVNLQGTAGPIKIQAANQAATGDTFIYPFGSLIYGN